MCGICGIVSNRGVDPQILVKMNELASHRGPDDEGYWMWNGNSSNGLFQMTGNSIWAVVKKCTRLAGIKKNITTHGIRHTCATHMLKNGAPIRHIQEMLGHESLESTQIYTRVTINDLKEVHAKYHPGENMEQE